MSYKVLICSFYPVFSGTGGAEKVFWRMSNELVSRGYDVYALGFESKKNNSPFFETSHKITKINAGIGYRKSLLIQLICLLIFKSDWRRKFRDYFEGKRKGKRIIPEIERFSPDIIISYQIEMTYVLKDILRVSSPVVTMLHNDIDILLKGKQRLYSALEKGQLTQVLLPSYQKDLNKYVTVDSVVIPNEVPSFTIEPNLKNHSIITVGRICDTKNQIDLINAFSIFCNTHPSWKLLILGDCNSNKDYYDSCIKLVTTLDLQEKIQFIGTSKNVSDYLQQSSIFAFPSKFEGFPLALTEAMSMGLGVIGYNTCSGVNEIIKNHQNGLLVNNNYTDLANGLNMLANSYQLRIQLGKQAKSDMKQYDSSYIFDKWSEVIKDVINCQRK